MQSWPQVPRPGSLSHMLAGWSCKASEGEIEAIGKVERHFDDEG